MGKNPGSGAYVNARVFPMGPPSTGSPGLGPEDPPWATEAQAILWKEGRVQLVGTDAEVRHAAKALGIQPQDLGGRTVLPGFVDAHTHFLHIGVKRHRPDLSSSKSKAEALATLKAWLMAHPGAEPVIGERWDESSWGSPERPHRAEIDEAVREAARAGAGPRDRMVVLRRVCGHVAVAGTSALAPIRKRWDDDATVDLETGVVLEDASLYLNEVLPASDALLDVALQEATRECHALGVTAVGDYSQAPYRAALLRASAAGTLGMRVASSIYVQQLQGEVAAGFRTGRRHGAFLRDGGLKVFLDGSLGAHTAALREPYGDVGPGGAGQGGGHGHPKGRLNWTGPEVDAFFGQAHRAGIQVHAHAIGDAAIDQGLAAFARLAAHADLEGEGWRGNAIRHRFEHFEVVHDDQARRTASLGIVSSSQPNFVGSWSAKGGMYEARLGHRFALNNRFRTLLDAGIPLAFGSDGMPPGPLLGIRAAVLHPDPRERLGFLEAAWHYTWWAAWSLHWEDDIGSLEEGKRADLVVLESQGDGGWAGPGAAGAARAGGATADGEPAGLDPTRLEVRQTVLDGIPRLPG